MFKKVTVGLFFIQICIFPIFYPGAGAQQNKDISNIFREAKKKCLKRQWDEAANLFEEIIQNYPESQFNDDAHFWRAYCEEKIPGRNKDAFFKFSTLVKTFPESPWIDDAMIHQISLAETFIREGQAQYRPFLVDKLESEIRQVQQRAAIALGKLGDKHALIPLHEMKNDEDLGELAANLIEFIETEDIEKRQKSDKDTSARDLRIVYDKYLRKDAETPIEPIHPPETKNFLWFSTKRYNQYRSMLRKYDDWPEEELFDFALWHIVDTDQFEEYRVLTNEYDRSEWWRKFWKERDPTPTTPENEFRDEFERRIQFAKSYFSDFWNASQFNYLPDQHMRYDWYHAPWDARGELYIKYGEPSIRSVSGWHTEEWVYYKIGIDFLVKQYMTNIYGNAIAAGQLSRQKYRDFVRLPRSGIYRLFSEENFGDPFYWNSYLDANYIYNNQILYRHDYAAEPLEDFKLTIEQLKGKDTYRILVYYSAPVKEFGLSGTENNYQLSYLQRYIVLDEDSREVGEDEVIKTIANIPDKDNAFEERFEFKLQPGTYTLHLRIKDNASEKMGIFSKGFQVQEQ